MRIRQVKPEFWKHEELAGLPRDARLLFIGMLCLADGWGLVEDRPKRIRAELFPYDDDITHTTFAGWLDALCGVGLLMRYVDGTTPLLFIPTFRKHQQNGMHREEKSKSPRWRLPSGHPILTQGGDQGGAPPGDQGGEEGGDDGAPRVAIQSDPSRGNGQRATGNGAAGKPVHPGDPGGGSSGETGHPDALAAAAAAGGFTVDPRTGEILDSKWLEVIGELRPEQVVEVFSQAKRLTSHEVRYPSGFAKALEALRAERRIEQRQLDQQRAQRVDEGRRQAEAAQVELDRRRSAHQVAHLEAFLQSEDGAQIRSALEANPAAVKLLALARKHALGAPGANLSLHQLVRVVPELERFKQLEAPTAESSAS